MLYFSVPPQKQHQVMIVVASSFRILKLEEHYLLGSSSPGSPCEAFLHENMWGIPAVTAHFAVCEDF